MRAEGKRYSETLIIAANQHITERDYWLNHLSGDLVKSHFPYDKGKKIKGIFDFHCVEFVFSHPLFLKLMKLCKGSDYTLNAILVTGLMVLLHKYTGNKDIILGAPIYKQENEGPFINTVLIMD